MPTDRDKAILREILSEKITTLEPLTSYSKDWRRVFAEQVTHWRTRANGCPEMSEGRSEYNQWSLAHKFVLEDSPLKIGEIFSTEFESGCIVETEPDSDGNFQAKDSDGVSCSFNVVMVNHGS